MSIIFCMIKLFPPISSQTSPQQLTSDCRKLLVLVVGLTQHLLLMSPLHLSGSFSLLCVHQSGIRQVNALPQEQFSTNSWWELLCKHPVALPPSEVSQSWVLFIVLSGP